VKYARGRENGIVNAIYVRGDELTQVFEEGPSKGLSRTIRIVSKRSEGNKLTVLFT
jgi:hypothetical protein